MQRPEVSLLITDLDNTLYDWVSAFVPALYAMVHDAAQVLAVPEEQLLDELQEVHRRHGDSEHPFALLETRSVRHRYEGVNRDELKAVLDRSFHAFNKVRKEKLKLYNNVRTALASVHRSGVPIVGYTDARIVNSLRRLERLDIKEFFSRLYAPDHVVTYFDFSEHGDFIRRLPNSDRKPNPQTLLDICAEYDVAPACALYVGDSLARDVFMAKRAGVRSAWAKYGTQYDRSLWTRLVRVTHWTGADMEAEKALREAARDVAADHALEDFSDILELYAFKAPAASVRQLGAA